MPAVPKHIVSSLLMFLLCDFSTAQITASYTISSEGASPKITTVQKNSKGYFLAGTTNGLYKFDGHSFTPFDLDVEIKNKSVTAIAEDKNSKVWVGFQSGEIGFLKNKSVELLHAEEGHPAVAITSILADTSGTVYFATAGEGIYYYTNKRFYNIDIGNGLSDNYVYEILSYKAGIIACTDKGLNTIHIKNGKKSIYFFTSANGLPDNIVRCVYPKNSIGGKDSSGSYWIGMQDKGAGTFSGSDSTYISFAKDWSYGQVNSLIYSGKQLWIATQDKGIVIMEFSDSTMDKVLLIKNQYTGYGKASNLLSDDEGNIWFTSNNQLIKPMGHDYKIFFLLIKSIILKFIAFYETEPAISG